MNICRDISDSVIQSNSYNDFFKDRGFIYLCMPYMIASNEYRPFVNELLKRSSCDNTTLVAFMDKIYRMLHIKSGTCSDTKLAIRNILIEPPKLEDKYNNSLRDKINRIVEAIRNFQFTNKLMESALINAAPIVPYSGTISVMWNNGISPLTNIAKTQYNKSGSFIIDFKNIIMPLGDDLECAYNFLDDLYMEYGLYISGNSGLMVANKDDILLLDKLLLIPELESDKEANIIMNIQLYYLLAHFVYFYKENWKEEIIKYLNRYIALYKPCTENYKKIFTFIKETIRFGEYSSAIEFWDEMGMDSDKYNSIYNIIDDTTKLSEDKETTYDIQQMISYIHNRTHLRCDTATNTTFTELLSDRGENISYYEDNMMTVLVGNTLMMPYIDMANDCSIKVLCMNEDGKLYTRYLKEVI